MYRCVDIAGVSVHVEAADAPRWDAVDALFGGCVESTEPAAIVIEHRATAPQLPERRPDQVFGDVEAWYDEDGVSARHVSGTAGRRRDERITVGGWTAPYEPVRAFRMATQLPLMDALGQHGRYALHAASLERDGTAVLVLGGSGAGKSTLAYAASLGGWRIVADDLSIVGAFDVVQVSGLPKPMNVPSDTFATPPEGARPIPDDKRDRWVLPASAITARGQYPVRAVVTLGHSTDSAAVEELPASPARLGRLIAGLPLGAMPSAVRAFFPVAARLSRLPAYTYMHPVDPAQRVPAAIELLNELWAELAADDQ